MAEIDDIAAPCCRTLDEWGGCVRNLPPTMHNIRRVFTLLAQYLFSSKDRLEAFDGALDCRVYTGRKGDLSIQPATVVDRGDTEIIPGIVVQLSEEGLQFEKESLRPETNESVDYAAHEETWKASATVQFKCLDRDAEVAGMMADALMMFMVALRDRLLYGSVPWLKGYDPVSVTEPKKSGNDSDDSASDVWYESVVSVKITIEYRVFVAHESKRLKEFSVYSDGKV